MTKARMDRTSHAAPRGTTPCGGDGRYTDDIAVADVAHIAFLRSPHAHARIAAIDMTARALPTGVVAS